MDIAMINHLLNQYDIVSTVKDFTKGVMIGYKDQCYYVIKFDNQGYNIVYKSRHLTDCLHKIGS